MFKLSTIRSGGNLTESALKIAVRCPIRDDLMEKFKIVKDRWGCRNTLHSHSGADIFQHIDISEYNVTVPLTCPMNGLTICQNSLQKAGGNGKSGKEKFVSEKYNDQQY
jgi:hypothetical protein